MYEVHIFAVEDRIRPCCLQETFSHVLDSSAGDVQYTSNKEGLGTRHCFDIGQNPSHLLTKYW